MISVSAALHVGMITLLVFVPAHWWQRPLERPAERDDDQSRRRARSCNGGMTSISSRPIQQAVESPEGDAEPAAGGEDA